MTKTLKTLGLIIMLVAIVLLLDVIVDIIF
jgi:hypothetical protein